MTNTITIFNERADRFSSIVAGVAGRWDAASPCEGWTAADVVTHVIGTQRDFLSARNPLLPEARPRGVLGVAASAYPSDLARIEAFAAATTGAGRSA